MVLPEVKALLGESKPLQLLEQLSSLLKNTACKLRIDFSVVDDIHYYNGVVFKGFVRGVPDAVLSGGQYDKLMRKMKRKSGAIGFAVYLDLLERLENDVQDFDVDTVLLYDEDTSLTQISAAVQALQEKGICVAAYRKIPEGLRYREAIVVR